jgi:hypothetical protein
MRGVGPISTLQYPRGGVPPFTSARCWQGRVSKCRGSDCAEVSRSGSLYAWPGNGFDCYASYVLLALVVVCHRPRKSRLPSSLAQVLDNDKLYGMAAEPPKDQEVGARELFPAPAEQQVHKLFPRVGRLPRKQQETPVFVAMLLDTLERQEAEKADFAEYRVKFHEADKEREVLRERERGHLALIETRRVASFWFDGVSTMLILIAGVIFTAYFSPSGASNFLLGLAILSSALGVAVKVFVR